jgi:hypothetical protein
MKKTASLFTILLAILVLTACSALTQAGNPSTANTSGTQAAPNSTTGAFGSQPLSEQEQLIIGIFKLEGTDQAVTALQAAELLPLWQTMKVLAASDTASPQEIQAIIDQVNETITVAQHQMITDMKLTRQDMVTVMQDQGLGFQQGQRGGFSGTPQAGQDQGGFPGGGFEGAPEGMPGGGFEGAPGGMPGGGFEGAPGGMPGGGPDGFFQGGGQNLTSEQSATLQARITQRAGSANRTSPFLLDALIKLLESKVQ